MRNNTLIASSNATGTVQHLTADTGNVIQFFGTKALCGASTPAYPATAKRAARWCAKCLAKAEKALLTLEQALEEAEWPVDATLPADATVELRVTGDDGLGTARRDMVTTIVTAHGGTVEARPVFVKGFRAARHFDLTITAPAPLTERIAAMVEEAQAGMMKDSDAALARAIEDGVTGPLRARVIQAVRRAALVRYAEEA